MALIKKITKIKHLGLYEDYTWDANLPEFKQRNIIYGWNGTGKTTLSKLLWALNSGSHPDFPSLEYTVKESDNKDYTQGMPFTTPVRVFNSEFIAENVDFETQKSKAITVILGEENKEALDQIKVDEEQVKELTSALNITKRNKTSAENARDSKFTEIAKTISQGTQGFISRIYRSPNAKTAFNKLTGKDLLDNDKLSTLSKTVTQENLPPLQELSLSDIDSQLNTVSTDVEPLLATTVESVVIERLKQNPDIAEWVETGLALHTKHDNQTCDFCGQVIQPTRIAELTAHFNKADAELKTKIDQTIDELRMVYESVRNITPVDKARLYKELQTEYETAANKLIEQRGLLLQAITTFGEAIKSKKQHTTEATTMPDKPELSELQICINQINAVIAKHNQKTANFEEQRKTNIEQIERHYLSTIYDEVKDLDKKIEDYKQEITKLINGVEDDEENIGINRLNERIRENQVKISSSHKACELLNNQIKTFLGHNEIAFDVDEANGGYKILRRDEPAKNLSEGERTAIAFVFFITQLNDDFDIKNGIVVIDDPVSSLDSNSQFQAFSFLKNATKEVHQLFMFTHNFDFLKLLLNLVKHEHGKDYSLYMVNNKVADNKRVAHLAKLDKSLEAFESEYHYLFNIVYNYVNSGGGETIDEVYCLPNIARKLLDTFLMFCVPKNCSTYKRLEMVDFDETKKAAIYKFVNDQSHITGSGFSPSLVPETQKNTRYLLELMESTYKKHYDYLVESISG